MVLIIKKIICHCHSNMKWANKEHPDKKVRFVKMGSWLTCEFGGVGCWSSF